MFNYKDKKKRNIIELPLVCVRVCVSRAYGIDRAEHKTIHFRSADEIFPFFMFAVLMLIQRYESNAFIRYLSFVFDSFFFLLRHPVGCRFLTTILSYCSVWIPYFCATFALALSSLRLNELLPNGNITHTDVISLNYLKISQRWVSKSASASVDDISKLCLSWCSEASISPLSAKADRPP